MRFLTFIGVLAVLGVISAGVFFFGGFYSVAGTAPDPGVVTWALVRVRTASIERHATDQPSIQLGDPEVVKAGARAFAELGCASCHGAPGVKWAKFSEGLQPSPPDLAEVGKNLEPAQIFWVVKNGINMTGMPSFGPLGADDQKIWQVAAFVRKLSIVSADDYKAWTASP
ncbi:MAG: c-type cytochrome [Stellaceae bacterium]